MTTSSQQLSPAYQACLEESLRQASSLIEQWCTRLQDILYARTMALTGASDRHPVQQAIVALRKERGMVAQGFMAELRQAIADDALSVPVRKSGPRLRSLSSLRFDDLELMEDHQVQETVERARLEQTVRLSCDAALAGFSARLSTVQGLAVVKADRNPLRPDIVLPALLKVLGDRAFLPEVRACLLLEGGQILGDELQSLYLAMDAWLARQGIAPAAYSVIASPESQVDRVGLAPEARLPQPPASVHEAAGAASFSADLATDQVSRRKKLLTLDHLHHLLAGDYESRAGGNSAFTPLAHDEEVVHQDFSPTLPAALDVLTELQEKGPGMAPATQARPAPPLPVAQLRAHLKTESRSLGQALAVEVVGLMIEQITRDERLLQPVRRLIAHAEPAFLRLASTDTRFFSDKSHPARKLLDAITSASLGYASEAAPGFAEFMQSLQAMAPQLTEEHAGDAQHFAALLDKFERQQARSTPDYRQAQLQAVRALLQAEQRNLLAEKMAADIKARADFFQGNRIITAFLTGPWAQVMAREQLLAEEAGVAATQPVFRLVLDDLFWSLDLAQVAGQRQRLLALIPVILKRLREGLQSIDYSLDQAAPFFDELMAIHQAGLRLQPDPAPAVAPPPACPGREALEELFEDDAPGAQTWLAPTEAQHSGFMQDWDSTELARDEPASDQSLLQKQAGASGVAAQAPAAQPEVDLKLGAWVDMLVEMQWLRAQLSWISPEETLYMFITQDGRKHSMTRRVLQHLLILGFVKVVSAQGVLEGALDSVARTAMRNSMDSDSAF